MESRAALGAAAALALTVTGGVSALFLAVGQASGAENSPTIADSAVTVEYVDQYGNPVAPPLAEAGAANPEVILVNPDGTVVGQSEAEGMTAPAMAEGYGEEAEAYEEEGEEYDAGEEEEGAEYEEGEEYEDDEDEYAAGEHIEDEDHEDDPEHEEHEDD